jgi:hypothetical protein
LADGGDESSFERAWPSLRDEHRRQRVVAANERERGEGTLLEERMHGN